MGSGSFVYFYMLLPFHPVSTFPVIHPKKGSAHPAYLPALKHASVEGCFPLSPVWGAQGTTPGSFGTPVKIISNNHLWVPWIWKQITTSRHWKHTSYYQFLLCFNGLVLRWCSGWQCTTVPPAAWRFYHLKRSKPLGIQLNTYFIKGCKNKCVYCNVKL